MKKDEQDTIITTIYVVVEAICKNLLESPAQEQKLTDAEVITIAISSALYFESNHDKALLWLRRAGYFPQMLTLSRFNRRVHALKYVIEYCLEKLSELFLKGNAYIQDSMPVPVCKRARASRNKKVRGREFYGYCAAKKEKFFGFRLHMVTDLAGVPVSIELLPGAYHDLTCMYEITSPLPEESKVLGDKGYTCAPIEKSLQEFGIYMMPKRRKNQKNQWHPLEERFINENRRQIETSFSLLSEVMGLNRLKARTLTGFLIKVNAAILALVFHITFVL